MKYGNPEQGYYYNESHKTIQAWIEKAIQFDGFECLEWPFNLGGGLYGLYQPTGEKALPAHRWVLIQKDGPPPEKWYHAAHCCDNKKCCNPNHLRWATPSENMQDKYKEIKR